VRYRKNWRLVRRRTRQLLWPGFVDGDAVRVSPEKIRADAGPGTRGWVFFPFGDRVFDAVLMVHVLTARNWRALLGEAHRVLWGGGVLAIGKTQGPPEGLDAKMRNRLEELIAGVGITEPIPDHAGMGEWLRARSSRHIEIAPARWTVDRTPREFFLRKQSAARFASLPADVREAALRSLAEWTEHNIGPLDTPLSEPHHFRLALYWLQGGSTE
jgi:SAM-dependent methyltransferase